MRSGWTEPHACLLTVDRNHSWVKYNPLQAYFTSCLSPTGSLRNIHSISFVSRSNRYLKGNRLTKSTHESTCAICQWLSRTTERFTFEDSENTTTELFCSLKVFQFVAVVQFLGVNQRLLHSLWYDLIKHILNLYISNGGYLRYCSNWLFPIDSLKLPLDLPRRHCVALTRPFECLCNSSPGNSRNLLPSMITHWDTWYI